MCLKYNQLEKFQVNQMQNRSFNYRFIEFLCLWCSIKANFRTFIALFVWQSFRACSKKKQHKSRKRERKKAKIYINAYHSFEMVLKPILVNVQSQGTVNTFTDGIFANLIPIKLGVIKLFSNFITFNFPGLFTGWYQWNSSIDKSFVQRHLWYACFFVLLITLNVEPKAYLLFA